MSVGKYVPPPPMRQAAHVATPTPTRPQESTQAHDANKHLQQKELREADERRYSGGANGPQGRRPSLPKSTKSTKSTKSQKAQGSQRSRRKSRAGGIPDEDDPLAYLDALDDMDTHMPASGVADDNNGPRDDQGGEGGRDRRRDEQKGSIRVLLNSRNQGNTGKRKQAAATMSRAMSAFMVRVGTKTLGEASRAKDEFKCFTNFASGYAIAAGEFLKPEVAGQPSQRARAFGAIKALQSKFFEELEDMGITTLHKSGKPVIKSVLLKIMPKFDAAKHVMSEGLQTMYCLAWPALDNLYVPRTPEQFDQSQAHKRTRLNARKAFAQPKPDAAGATARKAAAPDPDAPPAQSVNSPGGDDKPGGLLAQAPGSTAPAKPASPQAGGAPGAPPAAGPGAAPQRPGGAPLHAAKLATAQPRHDATRPAAAAALASKTAGTEAFTRSMQAIGNGGPDTPGGAPKGKDQPAGITGPAGIKDKKEERP